MNIKNTFEKIFGCLGFNLTDITILRLYYSAKTFVHEVDVSSTDNLYIQEIQCIDTEDLCKIAAIDVQTIIQHLPFLVANYQRFKELINGMDYKTIIILIHIVKTSLNVNSKKSEKNDAYYSFTVAIKEHGKLNTISKSEFFNIADSILLHCLDETLVDRFTPSTKEYSALSYLCSDLYMPPKTITRFCVDCYLRADLQEIFDNHLEGTFTRLSPNEIKENLFCAKKSVLKSTPIQCAQIISLLKQNFYYTASKQSGKTEKHITSNPLKRSRYFLEKSFLSAAISMCTSLDNDNDLILVDATPFFVEDIINKYTNCNVFMINQTSDESDLFILHYENTNFCSVKKDNIDFFTINELAEFDDLDLNRSVVIISENSFMQSDILQVSEYYQHRFNNDVSSVAIIASDRTIKTIAENSKYNCDLFILPSVGYFPQGNFQSLLIISSEKSTQIKIHKYKLHKTEEFCMKFGWEKAIHIYKHDLIESISLRAYNLETPKDKQRKPPIKIPLSKEIAVFASTGTQPGICRGQIYVKVNGKQCKDSIKNYNVQEDAFKDYSKEYIKSKKLIGDTYVHINDIIKPHIIEQFGGKGISLRSVCLLEDLSKFFSSNKDIAEIERLVDGPIGNMNADYHTFEDIEREVKKLYADRNKQAVAIKLIINLSIISSDAGYTINDFDEYDDTRIIAYGKKLISQNIAKSVLGLAELQAIYRAVINIEDISMRVALLLRIFGLEPGVICALTRGDVKVGLAKDAVQLRITKTITTKKNRIQPVSRRSQKRIIPIPRCLSKEIQQLASGPNKEEPLLTINGERISPKQITDQTHKIMTALGHHNIYIDIVEPGNIIKKIDISSLSKDIFRSTFSSLARLRIGMSEHETDYILGKNIKVTFGRYYIGYMKNSVQLRMAEQLQAFEQLLKGDDDK